jgi:hypothetical protein
MGDYLTCRHCSKDADITKPDHPIQALVFAGSNQDLEVTSLPSWCCSVHRPSRGSLGPSTRLRWVLLRPSLAEGRRRGVATKRLKITNRRFGVNGINSPFGARIRA